LWHVQSSPDLRHLDLRRSAITSFALRHNIAKRANLYIRCSEEYLRAAEFPRSGAHTRRS